jgi:hypothetical protein
LQTPDYDAFTYSLFDLQRGCPLMHQHEQYEFKRRAP